MKPIFEQSLAFGRFVVYDRPPEFDFAKVKQVHGAKVLNSRMVTQQRENLEADGLYCLNNEELIPMAIKTADCLPIAVCGEKGVAIVHAGWRGVAANIFSPKNLQSISPTSFFIGPAIAVESYEVQPDFLAHFPNLENCFIHKDQKIYFDLKLAALSLIKVQYPLALIEMSELDTFTHPKLHSYRKDKTESRNWNLWLP